MKRRIFSIALALVLCLGLLPGTAWAAEERQTRTETLVLTNQDQESLEQGWSWKQTDADGYYYTLTLDNVNFEVENGNAIEFQMDTNHWLGAVTIVLTGENRVVSTNGCGFYSTSSNRMLPLLSIGGSGSLDVEGGPYGINIYADQLKIKDTTVNICSQWDEKSTQWYGIHLGSYGILSLENSTVSANRIYAHTLTAKDSQLTATTGYYGYAPYIIETKYFSFSGGKLIISGPEQKADYSCGVYCTPNGDTVTLSDCEIDIRNVDQGVCVSAGTLSLQNVTGTVFTTKSAPSNSIYQNAAFDGLRMDPETHKDCRIFAQTGQDVVHTFLYGDYTIDEDTVWSSTGVHIQEGCSLTVAEGKKLTFTKDVTIHGKYESGYVDLVNNGTLEFAEDNKFSAKLINNGTLLVSGFLDCAPENFINKGTFNGILDDSAQQIFGSVQIRYNKTLGKWTPTSYWSDTIHVTDQAVLTILDGKSLDASKSEKGITADNLQDYLSVAETGKLIVEPEGQLLLPAGITQAQLDALRLSGGGTVKVGDENANWVTVMDGDKTLSARLLIPNSMLDVTGLQKDGYFLQLHKDTEDGELFNPATAITENLTLYVKWLKLLPAPEGEGSTSYQVVMEEGLSKVPAELAGTYDTAEAVQTALKAELTNTPAENTAVYDVTLLVSKDGGSTWEPADADNFPSNGTLTVTLPYPKGTDGRYTFTVVHMFTTKFNGKTPGDIETPAVTNTADGIRFTVTGLSPIAVGWTEPKTGGSSGSSSSGGSGISTSAVTVKKPDHGEVSTSRKNAPNGSTVTVTVTPDEGYILDVLTVTDSRGNELKLTGKGENKYTFRMPDRAVTVEAVFAPIPDETEKPCDGGADCPSRAFSDLSGGAWYHEAADFVLSEGIMSGYGDGRFGPGEPLSRAMLAQLLYNRAGRPAVSGKSPFTDVADGTWYTGAVAWASANQLVGGYGDGRYGPDDLITREQLAVMLWRYMGSPAADRELSFADADQVSGWALEAMKWAAANGVISGGGDGKLNPKGNATRIQTAQMLKNVFA